ncbi:MAG: hypothetical protein VB142_01640, partial [Burkholderia sp.]
MAFAWRLVIRTRGEDANQNENGRARCRHERHRAGQQRVVRLIDNTNTNMNSHNNIPRAIGWGAAALCLSISLAGAAPALAQEPGGASAPALAQEPGGASAPALAQEPGGASA